MKKLALFASMLLCAVAHANQLNPCVKTTETDCVSGGLVTLYVYSTPTTWPTIPYGATGLTVNAGENIYSTTVQEITTNWDCEVTTNITQGGGPYIVGTSWVVTGPASSYTASGTGLSAHFDATHGLGVGSIKFSVAYNNDSPCNAAVQTNTVTVYFTVVNLEPPCSSSSPQLASFSFESSPNWLLGDQGQQSLSSNNVQRVTYSANHVLQVDSSSASKVRYSYYETNGQPNFNCSHGAIAFWFKPHWNGGTGPGNRGTLIDIGDTNSTSGWWFVGVNPTATQLTFQTKSNGVLTTYLTQSITDWSTNNWYHLIVNYDANQTSLYTNGVLAQTGTGLVSYPSVSMSATYGFGIGSDRNGQSQARGEFDNAQTFDCPLTGSSVTTAYSGPYITGQPVSQTACVGESKTFSVTAVGQPTLTYQWRKNGVNISGATLSSYTKTSIQTTDAGSYSVLITNAWRAVTSSAATLTVNTPPAIQTQPADTGICPNGSATLSLIATGTSPQYQWFRNGTQVNGATTTAINVSYANVGTYTVVVSGCSTTVTSRSTVVTQNPTTVITVQPVGGPACLGETTVLSAEAAGTCINAGCFNWQWQKNGVDLYENDGSHYAGTTSSNLTIVLDVSDNASYSVIATGGCGSATSDATVIYIGTDPNNQPPVIDTVLSDQTIIIGQTISLAGDAEDDGLPSCQPLSVTWSITPLNDSPAVTLNEDPTYPGDLSRRKATFADLGQYVLTLIAFDGQATTTSSFTATVLPPLSITPANITVSIGAQATFSAIANVTADTYQWKKNGTPIAGATDSILAFSQCASNDSGTYSVAITGPTPASATATLNVQPCADFQNGDFNNGLTGWVSTDIGVVLIQADDNWDRSELAASLDDVAFNGDTADTLSQTFCVSAGSWYQVSFDHGAGVVLSGDERQILSVEVRAGDTLLYHADPWPWANHWNTKTFQFKAPDGVTQVTLSFFRRLMDDNSCNSGLIESTYVGNVQVTQLQAPVNLPVITSQPIGTTANAGSQVAFTVAATPPAGTTLSYQWMQNGNAITGAQASAYTLNNVVAENTATYSVVVTAGQASIQSGDALLVVFDPGISTQPQSVTADPGNPAIFSVQAVGTGPLTYQWQRNGVDLTDNSKYSGTATTVLTVATDLADDGSSYIVVVQNPVCMVTSETAVLHVRAPPMITAQPQSLTVVEGNPASFSVTATPSTVTYQWKKDGTAIPDATSSTYSIAQCNFASAGFYQVAVSDSFGSVVSSIAVLTVATTTGGMEQDFSSSANPTGAWSYGYRTVNTGEFHLLQTYTTITDTSGTAASMWSTGSAGAPAVIKNTSAQDYHYRDSQDALAPDEMLINSGVVSGDDSSGVVRYIVPSDGSGAYKISANVRNGFCGGASVDCKFHISVNGTELGLQSIGPSTTAPDQPAYVLSTTTGLQQGDVVDLEVTPGDSGDFADAAVTLSVTMSKIRPRGPDSMLAITAQPSDTKVGQGGTAYFTVAATGSGLTYQWQRRNGYKTGDLDPTDSRFIGLNTPSLTILNAHHSDDPSAEPDNDSGMYYVTVTDSSGSSITSDDARLNIFFGPYLTSDPQSLTALTGQDTVFTASAAYLLSPPNHYEQLGDLHYQWQFGGTDIPGASGNTTLHGDLPDQTGIATLTVHSVQSGNAGQYTVKFSNDAGTATSLSATLSYLLDSDLDGMADNWEQLYFGNLNQTANGDPDGDNLNNIEEFIFGTDPTVQQLPDGSINVHTPLK